MVKPWRPPSLFRSVDEVRIWNALLLWAGQPMALNAGATARFSAVAAPDPHLRGHHLGFGAQVDMMVAPLQFPFAQMFEADFDVDELERLPLPVAARLDAAVIDAIWAVVPDPHVANPAIRDTGPLGRLSAAAGVERLEDWHWFQIDIDGLAGMPAPCRVLVGARIADILTFTAGGAIAPRTVPNTLAMQITTPVRRLLGSITLSRQDLIRLSAGDVIILAEGAATAVKLCGQGWIWSFQPHDKGYAIISAGPAGHQVEGMETEPMTDDRTTDALTFLVQFEIGQLDVPLGALDAWRPGTVVSFEPPQLADGVSVTLRVHGREIGTGDLISIDDRLAVRITHLIGASAP